MLSELTIPKQYTEEALLIRYAALALHRNKYKNEAAKQLVELANKLKLDGLPYYFQNAANDLQIMNAIKPNLKPYNLEGNVLELNKKECTFIDSIGIGDELSKSNEIAETLNAFFEKGNFPRFNTSAYRFLKKLQGINEYDINDLAIRQLISAICINEYEKPIINLNDLSNQYSLFDYKIYVFLLQLIRGNFDGAFTQLLQIQTNISEDLFKIVSEEDIAFYLSLILLIKFNPSTYKDVLSKNDCLIYQMYDKYPKFFNIIDIYNKCDYADVSAEFKKIMNNKILKDPFLVSHASIIEEKIKMNMLKEILSISKKFDSQKLCEMLNTSSNFLENLVNKLYRNGFPILIDAVSNVILFKEEDQTNVLLENSYKLSLKNMERIVNLQFNNLLNNQLNFSDLSKDNKTIKFYSNSDIYKSENFLTKMGRSIFGINDH